MRRFREGKDYRRRLVPRQPVYLDLVGDPESDADFFAEVFLRTWKKIPREVRTEVLAYVKPTGLWVSVETLFYTAGECRLGGRRHLISASSVKVASFGKSDNLEHTIAHELAHSFLWAEMAKKIRKESPAKTDPEQRKIVFERMRRWPEKNKENHVEDLLESWGLPLPPGKYWHHTERGWERNEARPARSRSRGEKGNESKVAQRSRAIPPRKTKK